MRHVVIIPARNEAAHIEATLQSILNQSKPPDRIYVVDDGSSDKTPAIVADLARISSTIRLLRIADRGHRRMGEGVVHAFAAGYTECKTEVFTYISKLDADLILPERYFEILLDFLDEHLDFGVAGGVPYDLVGGKWRRWRIPAWHVPGPLKTMRRSAYEAIGGLVPCLGWDILDEVKMRSLGFRTGHLEHLRVLHQRPHASAEGVLKGKAQWGEGAYVIGSHPLFVFARAFYRMWEPPYATGGLAVLWGYCRAAARRVPRIVDENLINALRREQLHRLFHLNRLPSRTGGHPSAGTGTASALP